MILNSRHARSGAFLLALVCVALGSVGCKKTPTDARVTELVKGITNQSVRRHMEALLEIGPRPSNDAAASKKTVDYISDRLVDYGYFVEEERFQAKSRWDGSDVEHRNIMATLVGRDATKRILEIGAHYDTVPGSPGADDNGSGVVALLEVARALRARNYGGTIRLCFFAMEEDGLVGSINHVTKIRQRGEPVKGVIVLEMVGYTSSDPDSQKTPARVPLLFWPPRTGDFICVVGNLRSSGLGGAFEGAAQRYTPDLEYFSAKRIGALFRDSARSDHFPYWKAGLRGVMITDTANFRNPHYHRRSDTIDTIDFPFLARVARATAATAAEWAGIR